MLKKIMKNGIKFYIGLFIGIAIIVTKFAYADNNNTLSAVNVDIDTTNMSDMGSNKKLNDALVYLYNKLNTMGRCIGEKVCLEKGYTVEWANDKTYMGILYLNPADLTATCNETLASQNLNNQSPQTPTEVKTGCMKWYIYGTDTNNDYLAILDHNTTANVKWSTTSSTNVAFEDSEAYEYLTDLTKPVSQGGSGWLLSVRILSGQELADFFNATTWDSSDYNSYFYFEGTGENKQVQPSYSNGAKSSYAWLYDYSYHCEANGCNHSDNYETYAVANTSATNKNYGYFTSTPVGAIGANARYWFVYYQGSLASNNSPHGIRPVITLPREMFE